MHLQKAQDSLCKFRLRYLVRGAEYFVFFITEADIIYILLPSRVLFLAIGMSVRACGGDEEE